MMLQRFGQLFGGQGRHALHRLLTPAAPVSPRPAEPLSGQLGGLWLGLLPGEPLPDVAPLHDWATDPLTRETLPRQADRPLAPWRFPAARVQQQHGWFAALARRHALGDPQAAALAIDGIDGWLRQDLPGQGIGWLHGTDPALRLLHWYAALSWLGPAAPEALRARLAGSARWHLLHLERRMPESGAEGLRRVLHLCGMIAGGFTFPGLSGARAARAAGLSGLRDAVQDQLHPDGVGRDRAFQAQARALWAVAFARHIAWREGAAFPAGATAALACGARLLYQLAGPLGTLPAIGEEPVGELLPCAYPLAWSLWNLCLSTGLETGAPAPGAAADPRLRWLGGALPAGSDSPPEELPKTWALWSFREGGLAVAAQAIRGRPARVVADFGAPRGAGISHPGAGAVLWEIGDVAVLTDPGSAGDASDLQAAARAPAAHNRLTLLDAGADPEDRQILLDRARVDGKKARISGSVQLQPPGLGSLGSLGPLGSLGLSAPGSSAPGLTWTRDVLLNQSRLICTDRLTGTGRHPVAISWQMGPGWLLQRTETGFTARNGDLQLIIQLPAALTWSIQEGQPAPEPAGWVWSQGRAAAAPRLFGTGEIGSNVQSDTPGEIGLVCSFEVR